ncbi:MAG: hypothetical protein ACREH5_09085 [Candidatus Omnitrophota bacterium]
MTTSQTTEKRDRIVTPIGAAKWAHVFKPQEGYSKKDKPKFKIDVCFDAENPEWKAFCGTIKKMVDALPAGTDENTGAPAARKYPFKREVDADDKPTGRWFIQAKTGEQYPPKVFDKFGKEMDGSKMVGNESKVQISVMPTPYEGFGGGITLYLNAVQVLDLVEYKGQTADSYGFSSEPMPNEPTPNGAKTEAVDPTKLPKDHPDYMPF